MQLPTGQSVKAGVRLKLKTTAGVNFNQIGLDRLRIYLSGADDVARRLYELALASAVGVMVVPTTRPVPWSEFLHASQVQRVGFADDEALLPVTWRSFQGYRLLQEYFSFPQRFLFFDITGLKGKVQRCKTDELEIVLLFGRGEPVLEKVVDASNFSLFCTPVINLFSKRADRIPVTDSSHEFHVLPDRTRPMDFEVYEVTSVAGHGVGADSEQAFLPFYAAASTEPDRGAGYFTVRREPRLLSENQKRIGTRTSYIGTEVFISLVDPERSALRGRSAPALGDASCARTEICRCRCVWDSGKSDLILDAAAPVASIRAIKGPSRPYSPLADGAISWRFISHLSLNYLSLMSEDPQQDAAALREILELYASRGDPALTRQIEGIQSVRVQPVTRRLPAPGPITFGRGLEIQLEVDELAFEGSSAFLLGSVLEQFFARHVSLNSFTETALRSSRRGEVMRWRTEMGRTADPVGFLEALHREPYAYDFYQAMRRLENLHRDKPRLGEALRPADEPVRLGQEPSLSFAPAPLSAFEPGRGRKAGSAAGALLRVARSERAAAAASDGVRARAAAPRRRFQLLALPRPVPPPLPGAVLPSVGPGAAHGQPGPAAG